MHRLARFVFVIALIALGLAWPGSARAVPIGGDISSAGIPAGTPPELEDVGVTEHLDSSLPLDAVFRDESGKVVKLGDYFDGKRPVLFVFAYFTCPVLCGLILDDTFKALNDVTWTIGREFDMVVVSINPHETVERTQAKRTSLLNSYNRKEEGARGLHLLMGDKPTIARTTDAAGFRYKYDAEQDQFAHSSLLMIVKPNGQLARYLYGLEFPPNDIRLGLLEASEGRSLSTAEQIIIYCYHYDPKGGKYVLVASRVMKIGAAMTAIALGTMLAFFWIKERRKGGLIERKSADAETPGGTPKGGSSSGGTRGTVAMRATDGARVTGGASGTDSHDDDGNPLPATGR